MAKARRLLSERAIGVWTTDKAPDPEDEPLSFKGLRQDVDAAIGRALDILGNDPMISHLVEHGLVTLEIEETG